MSNEDTENTTPNLPRRLAIVEIDSDVYRIAHVEHDNVVVEQLHKDILGDDSWRHAHITDEIRIEILERALMARK